MLLNVIYIIVGIALVLWGADRLTDGAVAIAERMHIPQIVIGLTIVAMGTSMPEFCVSLVSALKGTPDMAVGNVVGSNVFNSLLIVGVAALIAPMTILPATVKKDIPFALVSSFLLTFFCIDGEISRTDAGLLFLLFVVFMAMTLNSAKTAKGNNNNDASQAMPDTSETDGKVSVLKSVGFVLLGLGCLIGGSNIFVTGASEVAKAFGISDAVIGLTIVAMGTSLPELATTAVSARKGNSGIAIGNVLGSNVFNILMVVGVTGLISPMTLNGITSVDLTMLVVSMLLLWLFSFTKYTIQRWEGAVLSVLFAVYLAYLVLQAIG